VPINFVKTKLALDSMETGEILEILLDDGEPIDNVPGSVEQRDTRLSGARSKATIGS